MIIDFQGQVVLITGATRGIGKQLADDFALLGANLILTGSNKELIEDLNREGDLTKDSLKRYYAVDFTNQKSLDAFLNKISSLAKIDVCINNAGINKIDYIDETVIEDWENIIAVNLEAPFKITRAVSKLMKKNNYGRIINIASIWGVISKVKRSIYSVSKFGIRGLTVSTALDLAAYNILVNSVSPGFVVTELTKRILGEEEMKKLAEQVPLGRFAMPDEISKVILFLASRHNTYITAQNIVVDGGFVNV